MIAGELFDRKRVALKSEACVCVVQVDPEWEGNYQVTRNQTSGLETIHKSLHLKLRPSMVSEGLLQVKCVASYPELYWDSSDITFTVLSGHGSGFPLGSQGE